MRKRLLTVILVPLGILLVPYSIGLLPISQFLYNWMFGSDSRQYFDSHLVTYVGGFEVIWIASLVVQVIVWIRKLAKWIKYG